MISVLIPPVLLATLLLADFHMVVYAISLFYSLRKRKEDPYKEETFVSVGGMSYLIPSVVADVIQNLPIEAIAVIKAGAKNG